MIFLKKLFKRKNDNKFDVFNDLDNGVITVKMNNQVAIVPYRIKIKDGSDFATNLRLCRKAIKLTQDQLAKEIGASSITIRSYEAKRRNPDAKNLCKLARYFGVDAISLLGTDIDK